MVPDTKADTLRPIILEHVDADNTVLMTDGHPAYRSMGRHLPHEVIDHEVEYVRDGHVHTQGIENYWSIFKRGLYGTYHHMSREHLHRYLAEFCGRSNVRKQDTKDQLEGLARGLTGKRLTWKMLRGQASAAAAA